MTNSPRTTFPSAECFCPRLHDHGHQAECGLIEAARASARAEIRERALAALDKVEESQRLLSATRHQLRLAKRSNEEAREELLSIVKDMAS